MLSCKSSQLLCFVPHVKTDIFIYCINTAKTNDQLSSILILDEVKAALSVLKLSPYTDKTASEWL